MYIIIDYVTGERAKHRGEKLLFITLIKSTKNGKYYTVDNGSQEYH